MTDNQSILPSSDQHAQAIALFRAGQYESARRALEEVASSASAAQDKRAMAESANDLGVTLQKLKKRSEARKQFDSAITLFGELGDDAKRAQALGNLGTLLADMKKYRESDIRLEQAAEVFNTLGDRQNEAFTLKWLSRVHLRQWDFLGAIFAFERALARLEPLPPDQKLLRQILQLPLRLLSRG